MYYSENDQFMLENRPIGINVLDFWKFAYSDLNSDPRDYLAEYLVSHALGIDEPYNKEDWTLFDILYEKIRVEVKSTGYYQTWRKDGAISSQRNFSIRRATDRNTGLCERQNDIYVFCLLSGETREKANPLRMENWKFYVVPTSAINKNCGTNKTISLGRIKSMGFKAIPYQLLRGEIDKIMKEMKATPEYE